MLSSSKEEIEIEIKKSIEKYKLSTGRHTLKISFSEYYKGNCILLDDNPAKISYGSNEKHWFECVECCHKFCSYVYTMTCVNLTGSSGCPFCANNILCRELECIICENKSFLNNPHAKDLLYENPRFIFKNCNTKYSFWCSICKHVIESMPKNISNG